MTEAERAETLRKAAFTDRAREVMSKYQSIIRALGAETEFPAEVNASGFLEWLKLELELLEGHLQHGRDFAASVSFRTLSAALVEAKCEHLFGLNLSDVDHFWRVPAEANSIGLRLYEEFWLQGGSDAYESRLQPGEGNFLTFAKVLSSLVLVFSDFCFLTVLLGRTPRRRPGLAPWLKHTWSKGTPAKLSIAIQAKLGLLHRLLLKLLLRGPQGPNPLTPR